MSLSCLKNQLIYVPVQVHAIKPAWLDNDAWHPGRVDAEKATVIIETADQRNILVSLCGGTFSFPFF